MKKRIESRGTAVRQKRTVILSGVLIALLLAAGTYYYVDCAYHPDLRISQRGGKENDRFEIITMVLAPKSKIIPLAKTVEDNIKEFQDWNNRIVDEVSGEGYGLPVDVRSFGKVENGQTTVRYAGYVTTSDGKRVDYHREHTFDFVIAPDEAWLKQAN